MLARTDGRRGVEEDSEGRVERAVEIPDVDEIRKDGRELCPVKQGVRGIE